jgi:hypothetical protein
VRYISPSGHSRRFERACACPLHLTAAITVDMLVAKFGVTRGIPINLHLRELKIEDVLTYFRRLTLSVVPPDCCVAKPPRHRWRLRVICGDFGMSAQCPVRWGRRNAGCQGVPIAGIGLDMIQAVEPEP